MTHASRLLDEVIPAWAGAGIATPVEGAEAANDGLGAAVAGSVGVAAVGAGGVLVVREPGRAVPPQVANSNSVPSSSSKPMPAACLRLRVNLCILVPPSLPCKSCGLPSLRLPVPA